ncbi:hypothetical protein F53441_13374 [Fusarium austroafricanum]|uniref:Uncharacterized protein n=1 Tax=Fusarium austroafricanum TaxID=2364996 RepID=A0A8H4NL79_9HYPO|nr:hypothetical protein F53441_13374 [Fusarium austroafricanum]
MVSTAPPARDDAESHRRADPAQDEDKNKIRYEKGSAPKRPPKLRHKKPEHYRQHKSEHSSQVPNDPYMGQARNQTVPLVPPYPGAYQAMPPGRLFGAGASAGPSTGYGHPGPYTYPGSADYFTVPRAAVQNPQYFGQPGPYNAHAPPTGYSDAGYGPGDYSYEEAPPYPDYPAQDPNRTPIRTKSSRKPKPPAQRGTGYASYTAAPTHQSQPRNRRPSMVKEGKMKSEDDITNSEIMRELRSLQRQVNKANAEIQSDPGRRDGRRYTSPSTTASHFTFDDTRSLDIERQRSDHLTSIIYRLLEDRQKGGYQDGVSRRNIVDLLRGMENRETGLVYQPDTQEIQSKLDTILEYLQIENRLESPLEPQKLPDAYNIRQGPRSRGQPSVVSASSVREPASPTLSRAPPRRFESYPSADKPLPVAVQPSNQARVRQKLPMMPMPEPEPEEELEQDPEIFEYEQHEPTIRMPIRPRRLSSNQSMASQDRLRHQSSVGQRSEVRPPVRKIVPGDQQKVKSGRQAYVETESDDEEPARPVVYNSPPKVPDAPGQSEPPRRRRSLRSVRFD